MEIIEFPSDTKPKVIFNYACERIAEPLIELGFKHRKSKKDIFKTDKDFIYRIWFQPSIKYGGSIRFIAHISVESEKLALWRKSKQDISDVNGIIITTTLANITKKEQTLAWCDVGTATERERVIEEILKQINDFAIPFFERFANMDFLADEIRKQGFLPHRFKKSVAYLEQHMDDFIQCFKPSGYTE